MSQVTQQRDRINVALRRSTYNRLEDLKEYESTSFNDLIAGLIDEHESRQGV
ncbi:hypothetical protein [Halovivax cerinus]|uniref:CopG family transcriptional regulator n=1 Tax=Halovivax cerinus TaxID=1487865 RepID=A0ABD5NKL3_9EURY|nr:hypothetical protein [Halovivax cerinus]